MHGLILSLLVWAAPVGAGAPGDTIELYRRQGCPHCERAEAFLVDLQARRPNLRVIARDVVADAEARAQLLQRGREAGIERLVVPTVVVRGRLFVGFARDGSTGAAIEAALDGATGPPVGTEADIPVLGKVGVGELGLPLFTIAVGLADGFNPCAMWVLLFLLSILVNLHSRSRMALIGGTFVLVSGAAYYAFMAAWLSVFVAAGWSRGLQVGLGLVALAVGALHIKDCIAYGRGPSLSIPERAKPGIYARVRRVVHAENLPAAVAAAVVLAVIVNVVELLCTAGLPAVYTQVLTLQDLPSWKYYGYLLLYIAAYMFDDAVMLTLAVVTLSRRKLQERGGRALKLLSGVVMVVLGALLVLQPAWLSFGGG